MTKKNQFKYNKPKKINTIMAPKCGYHDLFPVFSFKNYVVPNCYFSAEHSNEKRNSLYNFFVNIRELSQFNWGYMKNKPSVFHFHSIDEDIPGLQDFNHIDLAQFKVPGQKQGRFIGYFDEKNIFNILIYDSQHNVYSRN